MMARPCMIGEIRDMIERLHDEGRFAEVAHIMGDVDRFNFSGVPDILVQQIYQSLQRLRGNA